MTDTRDNTLTRENAIALAKPVVIPLKAERIQWILLLPLDGGNHPYDFATETEVERDARPEGRRDAGWSKRATPHSRTRVERDVA